MHAAGGGETLNAFHYVAGNLLQGRDPLGLDCGSNQTCPQHNAPADANFSQPDGSAGGNQTPAQAPPETPAQAPPNMTGANGQPTAAPPPMQPSNSGTIGAGSVDEPRAPDPSSDTAYRDGTLQAYSSQDSGVRDVAYGMANGVYQLSQVLIEHPFFGRPYSDLAGDLEKNGHHVDVDRHSLEYGLFTHGPNLQVAAGIALGPAMGAGGGDALAGSDEGAVQEGQTVYRVWGDEAGPNGHYWTRTDPGLVENYRDVAGLPANNSGRFVSEGRLTDTQGVEVTPGGATPLQGNSGGIDEVKIPNPESQVELTRVSGANPEL